MRIRRKRRRRRRRRWKRRRKGRRRRRWSRRRRRTISCLLVDGAEAKLFVPSVLLLNYQKFAGIDLVSI